MLTHESPLKHKIIIILSHIVNYEFTGLVCTTSNKHVIKTYNVTIFLEGQRFGGWDRDFGWDEFKMKNLRVEAGPDGHRSSFHGNPWHMRPIMGL